MNRKQGIPYRIVKRTAVAGLSACLLLTITATLGRVPQAGVWKAFGILYSDRNRWNLPEKLTYEMVASMGKIPDRIPHMYRTQI